MAKIE